MMRSREQKAAGRKAHEASQVWQREMAERSRTRFLRTFDDWAPSYARPSSEGETPESASEEAVRQGEAYVELGLIPIFMEAPKWRVSAWGLDDFGLEKDFSSFEEAKAEYDSLSEPVIQEELRIRGYTNA